MGNLFHRKIFQILLPFVVIVFTGSISVARGYQKFADCIILAEQSQPQILIVNVETDKTVWDWKPSEFIKESEHIKWFGNPSDAKVVYNGEYVLMCASGGACALIRIADKKLMFYAYAGKNPHSAEILPDGNIVCASSTDSRLTIFKTDTISFPDGVTQQSFYCDFAHNVVWDKKRNLLWTADRNQIKSWKYNFQCDNPQLTAVDSMVFEDHSGHDLFPVSGKDALFLSTASKMWIFDIAQREFKQIETSYEDIKSISAKTNRDVPVIVTPKEQWWTDEIIDLNGNTIVRLPGMKIYKARWVTPNLFSYPSGNTIKLCY